MENIVEHFNHNANIHADKLAILMINDRSEEMDRLTYQELQQRIILLAGYLKQYFHKGDRALLLYRTGMEFIIAFMACQFTGIVAVPMTLYSRKSPHFHRIQHILDDAKVSLVLTSDKVQAEVSEWLAQTPYHALPCLASDTLSSQQPWCETPLHAQDLAFLQYTSGSTGDPKGVMISHGNIAHNSLIIKEKYQNKPEDIIGGWLPFYHDMGLIGLIVQSLYVGASLILMSPVSFVKHPMNWLKIVSRYGITTSGGPNFCFDYCVEKANDEQLFGIDLSKLTTCFNGSEPIKARSLRQFSERFAANGFQYQSFYPCYGMAETTLFVSGGTRGIACKTLEVDRQKLANNQVVFDLADHSSAQTLISSGQAHKMDVLAVNPETHCPLHDDQVGEIWIHGESVAQGYWGKEQLTKETFQAELNPTDGKHYLRSGDMGFLHQGELFITGRLKDLIIINGRNIYPQDIEQHLKTLSPHFSSGMAAAFSVESDGREKVVVIQEIDKRHGLTQPQLHEIITQAKLSISRYFEAAIHCIEIIPRGTLPRTTSGKVQRRLCKDLWMKDKLNCLLRE